MCFFFIVSGILVLSLLVDSVSGICIKTNTGFLLYADTVAPNTDQKLTTEPRDKYELMHIQTLCLCLKIQVKYDWSKCWLNGT